MCEPMISGFKLAPLPARRPMTLPAASTLTSSFASRISFIAYSRPFRSASLYATRLTPPCGFLPNSESSRRWPLTRSPLTRGCDVDCGKEDAKAPAAHNSCRLNSRRFIFICGGYRSSFQRVTQGQGESGALAQAERRVTQRGRGHVSEQAGNNDGIIFRVKVRRDHLAGVF